MEIQIKRRRKMHRSINHQAKLQQRRLKEKKKELNSSEEDSECDEDKEQVPEDVEKEKINENSPHLVFITAMIKKCSGCDTKVTEK